MASSNAADARILQNKGTGDDRALALKIFWGLVIEAFRVKTVFWDNVSQILAYKNITSGKSWQFPVMGDDPTPEYHTPGEELLGMVVKMTEGTITVDDILVSHFDVAIDQIRMAHFDVIAPLARKLGRSLAADLDKKILYTALKSARHYALSGFHSGGNRVLAGVAGAATTAMPATTTGYTAFKLAISTLAKQLDEDNVPEDGRFLYITPHMRQVLTFGTEIFNSDFNRPPIRNELNKRLIGIVDGFNVLVTNHMPTTNITVATVGLTKYVGDWSYNNAGGNTDLTEGWSTTIYNDGEPVALALCGASEGQAAVGLVQAGPIYPFMMRDERRNTTFMKAQVVCGAGVMSPWCAGEIYCNDTGA